MNSDHHASAQEGTSPEKDGHAALSNLVLRKEVLLSDSRVVRAMTVHNEAQEALYCQAELVLVEKSTVLFEGLVHPERVIGPIPVCVVIDDLQALLEQLGVHSRIQSILGCVEYLER